MSEIIPSAPPLALNVTKLNNLLIKACKEGDIVGAKDAIEKGANVNHSHEDVSCLMWASCRGYTSIVSLLIEEGVNINYMNNHGSTALMNAASHDRIDIVRLFIDNGVLINAKSYDGSMTALFLSVVNGHENVAKLLLLNGALINDYTNKGNTPLIMAANRKNVNMVKLLLHFGANKRQSNNQGQTPLSVLFGDGTEEIIKCLSN